MSTLSTPSRLTSTIALLTLRHRSDSHVEEMLVQFSSVKSPHRDLSILFVVPSLNENICMRITVSVGERVESNSMTAPPVEVVLLFVVASGGASSPEDLRARASEKEGEEEKRQRGSKETKAQG